MMKPLVMVLLLWTAICSAAPRAQLAGMTDEKTAEPLPPASQSCVSFEMFAALHHRSMTSGHPSWMMGERFANLEEALEGYRRTGVSLVAYDGQRYVPASRTDDAGIDYLIPKMARGLGLDLVGSLKLFLLLLVLSSAAAGLSALFLTFSDWISRTVVILCVLPLVFISYEAKDLYAIQSAVVVGVVPWVLYLVKNSKSRFGMEVFLLLVGLGTGISDLLRASSGIGVAIFAGCIVLFSSGRKLSGRLLLVAALLVGAVIPRLYFIHLLHSRDTYLYRHDPGYLPTSGTHPFWHSVYIGFGFLSNPYVSAYKDEVAVQTVCSISPQAGYVSAEYEAVLKRQVWRLIREDPEFMFQTLGAKLGVIGLFLILFAHLGLPSAFWYPKAWPVELGFWCALGFNALFGILVVPHYPYLLGYIAFAVLYGIYSICHAIDCGILRSLWQARDGESKNATRLPERDEYSELIQSQR